MNFLSVIDEISKLNYNEKIAFHCSKEEFANDFINNCYNSLNISNFKFFNSEYFKTDNKYWEYKDETCYFIKKINNNSYEISYGTLYFAEHNCHKIYEYNNNIPINNYFYKILSGDDIKNKLNLIEKQYDDILTRLDKLSDKLNQLDKRLDNLQIIL